jgi:hypothetical protein
MGRAEPVLAKNSDIRAWSLMRDRQRSRRVAIVTRIAPRNAAVVLLMLVLAVAA